jgi:hypothetical protein
MGLFKKVSQKGFKHFLHNNSSPVESSKTPQTFAPFLFSVLQFTKNSKRYTLERPHSYEDQHRPFCQFVLQTERAEVKSEGAT